ncbi:hypothetical protein KKA33_01110 [Patescibacteria group bacterium]|nr:hypothetical protein [Patescibacteria group bacterium]
MNSPPFEAIGGYGDYYEADENVLRVNFRSAEETLCDRFNTSTVRAAVLRHPRAAYEFIRYFRQFVKMDPVERQFTAISAVRTSPEAADYFLKNQIEYRWHLIAFEIACRAAEEGRK